jgi:hypothetical protein
MNAASVFEKDWERLREIVEGRSEFGRGELAVTQAKQLAASISQEHHVAVTIPQSKLKWLRGGKRAEH